MNRPTQQTEYQKTFNELLLQVAGPALIILMVGSFVYFLGHLFYDGEYPGRVRWVFGLFVFAAVLISRISIEDGLEKAFFYGIALGLATWFVSCFFLKLQGALAPLSWMVNGLFIAGIWFCASKLTWDCTVNDSSRDVSSTGLVELFRRKVKGSVSLVTPSSTDSEQESSSASPESPEPELPLFSVQDSATEQAQADTTNATWDKKIFNMWPFKRKKNTPGLWILYFSLIAMPVFGFGQVFIPAGKLADRRFVFMLFVVYVFAALGLLMMTSLMSLQRYLKKRQTAMPDSIAKSWMLVGTIMAIVTLSFVWILPRPAPEYSLTQLLPKFSTPDRKTSKWGFGKGKKNDENANQKQSNDQAKQTEGKKNAKNQGGNQKGKQKSGQSSKSRGEKSKSGSKSSEKGKKSDSKSSGGDKSKGKQSSKGDKSKGDQSKSDKSKDDPSKSGDKNKSGDKSKSGKNDSPKKNSLDSYNEKQKQDKSNRSKNNSNNSRNNGKIPRESQSQNKNRGKLPDNKNIPPPPNDQPNLNQGLGFFANLIKWLSIIALIIAIVVFAIIYRKEIIEGIKGFIASLREFFANLFGNKKEKKDNVVEVNEEGRAIVPVKPFAAYGNPFRSGSAAQMTSEQLVAYTFEAFQAWGRLYQCPRLMDQTPHEYSRQLSKVQRSLSRKQMDHFADLVCLQMFGPVPIDMNQLEPLKAIWQAMEQSVPAEPSVQLAPS